MNRQHRRADARQTAEAIEPAKPENLVRAIDFMRRAGLHAYVPLLDGVRRGAIALVYITARTETLSAGELAAVAHKPTLALIGDDDGHATGPAGWACAVFAASWARQAVVHAAGAEVEHYTAAVNLAVATRRLLMVETESRFARQWVDLIVPTPTHVIIPQDGVHPCPSPPESRH